MFNMHSTMQRTNKNGVLSLLHELTLKTGTIYILSALPTDYRIYTKARKNGPHVSEYLSYPVHVEANLPLG